MIGEHEKPALKRLSLAILGILSVGMGLVGDSGVALGAGWTWRVFFGIASALMDLVFLVEFAFILARMIGKRKLFPNDGGPSMPAMLAAAAASVLPVALASGPFLFGWASQGDFSSLVRGLYAWPKPEAALASAAALRLFRLTLPFIRYRHSPNANAHSPSDSGKTAHQPLIALAAFIGLCFVGGFLADAWLVPGYQSELAARRQAAADALARGVRLARAADIVAGSADGLSWTEEGWDGSRADLVSFSSADGTSVVWFDARPEHRVRATLGALLSLSATAAFALYVALRKRAMSKESGMHGRGLGLPTGRDELAGLLGR